MELHRRIEGPEPVRAEGIVRPVDDPRAWRLGTGTLACPRCDAPVALAGGPVAPAAPLACPYCDHGAAVRDFLSLGAPSRPARVELRVVARRRPGHHADLTPSRHDDR